MGNLMRLLYVVAKAPNWMLSLVPQGNDVLGVTIQDNSNVLTKDATGNSKGIIFKKDATFTYIKFPVNVTLTEKESLEGYSFLLKAKVMAAKLSPIYVEKRSNRKVGFGFYERTLKLFNESGIYVDPDSLVSSTPVVSKSKKKQQRIQDEVDVVDEKLPAYQADGFVDVGLQPTQQVYSLPTDEQLIDMYLDSQLYVADDEEEFEEYYSEKKVKFFKNSKGISNE